MTSDETIRIPVGEEFSVRLESTPTTGYMWNVNTLPEGIQLLGSEYEKPTGDRPGDPGIQAFRFRALRAGEHLINFALKRPWEKNPIRSRTVRVEVT